MTYSSTVDAFIPGGIHMDEDGAPGNSIEIGRYICAVG